MSLEEELVASSIVLAIQRDHIKELEALVQELDALMQSRYPWTWNNTREGLLLQARLRELGIVRKESIA